MSDVKGPSFPIIGIGASAGGLNPFVTILEALPADFPAAIIFIQHLPADQKSLLPEILHTKFPSRDIFEITRGMAIDIGKVYVNPSDQDITIESGHFCAKPRAKSGIHLPIDTLFNSLAEDSQENAIVVVLSGIGTDGSRGAREVQCKGGAVLVQDPNTAEAPGMPEAAIEAGNIDEVLTPENIARHLVALVETFAKQRGAPDLEEQASLNALFNRLHEKAGFRFEDYKKTVVARRAQRRMLLKSLAGIDEYLELLDKDPLEINRLALDMMIGVTGFFRDPGAWENLKRDIVREMIARKSGSDSLRIWTPGCSTGEEPYSIAMMLLHEIESAKLRSDVQVFATDINEAALTIARNGKYPGSATADIPPEYLKDYFTCTEDGTYILINKYVRDHVVFAKQNVLADPPFSKLDLIICRNLMIYLDPAAQDRCLAVFHYALKENGFLFLGNAESLGHKKAFFESIGEKSRRLYKRVTHAKAIHYNFPTTVGLKTTPNAGEGAPATKDNKNRSDFAREQILTLFAPAAVLIDNRYEILYFNDPVKKFIEPPAGQPSFDFLAWIPEQMRNRVRGAIYNASQTGEPVSVVLSLLDVNKLECLVTLTVRLFKDPLDQSDTFLIIFSDQAKPGPLQAAALQCSEAEQAAIRQLERELTNARNELQINGEEMKSSNEELQSSNEELQAANEEMETSREELQSLNEELTTINGQLQTTVIVQETLNNDLSNFFSSTNIPTLFLDHEFKVRRFTPAMTRLIKLIPSDIGRPLADMSLEHLGAGALDDARTVLDNLSSVKNEISIGDACFERSTLPYRTADNRIEGVVMNFIDVTERKRAEEKLRVSLQQNQFLASVIESSSQPFGVGYLDGRLGLINKAFERLTGYSGDELHSIDWARALTPAEWVEIEQKKLAELNKTGRPVRYEKEYIRKDGTRVPIELLVHLEKNPEGKPLYYYSFLTDITQRKQAEEALRESEQHFRLLFETMLQGAVYQDAQGTIISMNHAAEQILGKTKAEFLGSSSVQEEHDTIRENGSPFPGQEHPAMISLQTGKILRDVVMGVYNPRMQSYRWISIDAMPLFRPGENKPFQVYTVFSDITDRKKFEETLKAANTELRDSRRAALNLTKDAVAAREQVERANAALSASEANLRSILDATQESIWVFSPEGTILLGNPTAFARLRMKPQDAIGKRFEEVLPPKLAQARREILQEVIKSGHPRVFEDERAGIYFQHNFYPIFDDTGRVMSVVSFSRDITERKRAEEELKNAHDELEIRVRERTRELREAMETARKERQHLYDVLETLPVYVILLSKDYHVPFANRFFRERFGESGGRRCYEYLFNRAEPCENCETFKVLKTNAPHHWEWTGPDERNYDIYDFPFMDTDGSALILEMGIDVTLTKKAQAALKQVNDTLEARVSERTAELAASNKELESFSYSVSHDLRAPLRTMKGFSSFLLEDYANKLDEDGRDFLKRIASGADKMGEIIDDMLSLAKISRREMNRLEINLTSIADSVLAELRLAEPERKVNVTIAENLKAYGDARLMKIALSNILGNAWKYSRKTPDATIEFGAVEKNGELVYYVRDNGAGFNMAQAHRLFRPFQRLHLESQFPGTGIGLAIVNRVIERHGGRIWAESEAGKGATFYFTIGKTGGGRR